MLLVYNDRHDDAVSEVARIEALPISSPAEGVIVFEHLAMLTSLLFQHDRTVEYANRALAFSDGQPMLELQALSVCASITALAGLVHDASWRVRRAEELVDQVGSHGFRAERAASRVALDWLGGRWDAALDGIGRWLPDVEAAQADQALGVLHGDRAVDPHVARRARRRRAAGLAARTAVREHLAAARARWPST